MKYGKPYLIVVDKGGILSSFNPKTFHTHLTSANGIYSWWNYLDSTYIVIADPLADATSIAEYIRLFIPKRRFFVVAVDIKDHDGFLQKSAWKWIKDHSSVY